jgi:hypothetical protein
MAFDQYDIYFSGATLPGFDHAEVRAAVARLFRAEGAKLERLFSGKSVRIKRAVDAETAGRYRAAMRQAGALVEVRPSASAEPPTAASAAAAAPAEQLEAAAPTTAGIEVSEEDPQLELLPPRSGSLADYAPPPAAPPRVDLSGMDLAFPGSDIDATPPPAPADIDIGELSAAPPNTGSLEDCVVAKPPRPIPDISHLRLADD